MQDLISFDDTVASAVGVQQLVWKLLSLLGSRDGFLTMRDACRLAATCRAAHRDVLTHYTVGGESLRSVLQSGRLAALKEFDGRLLSRETLVETVVGCDYECHEGMMRPYDKFRSCAANAEKRKLYVSTRSYAFSRDTRESFVVENRAQRATHLKWRVLSCHADRILATDVNDERELVLLRNELDEQPVARLLSLSENQNVVAVCWRSEAEAVLLSETPSALIHIRLEPVTCVTRHVLDASSVSFYKACMCFCGDKLIVSGMQGEALVLLGFRLNDLSVCAEIIELHVDNKVHLVTLQQLCSADGDAVFLITSQRDASSLFSYRFSSKQLKFLALVREPTSVGLACDGQRVMLLKPSETLVLGYSGAVLARLPSGWLTESSPELSFVPQPAWAPQFNDAFYQSVRVVLARHGVVLVLVEAQSGMMRDQTLSLIKVECSSK